MAHLPDLSIAIGPLSDGTSCRSVAFTVTHTAGEGTSPDAPALPVRVRVFDTVGGNPMPDVVGEALLFLPGGGGETSALIEFPMPADADFDPDFSNAITVVVDPDNLIAESDESNNSATDTGICVG